MVQSGGLLNRSHNRHSVWVHTRDARVATRLGNVGASGQGTAHRRGRTSRPGVRPKPKREVTTMKTARLRVALPVLTVLGAVALLPAAALANCDWYVKTALEQQQRNVNDEMRLLGCRVVGRQGRACRLVRERRARCLQAPRRSNVKQHWANARPSSALLVSASSSPGASAPGLLFCRASLARR